MCRANENLNVKLRLREINRRFAELSAVSSRLAGMAAQLDSLRHVDESICLFTNRSTSSRRRSDDFLSTKRSPMDATFVQPDGADRVPKRGVTGDGTPRSPARAGLVSWR
jgi:hypothetical protein